MLMSQPLEVKWKQQAASYREEAEKLPLGIERQMLLRRARQLETALEMNGWLSSPELRKPG